MKMNKYIKYSIQLLFLVITMVAFQSCFQDLGQNPPFDYPEQPQKPPLGEDGQMFYMAFNDNYNEYQSLGKATVVGSPGFAEGKEGSAYAGAANSYLSFSTASFAAPLNSTMTFTFWYKINGTPSNAGILTISPVDEGKAADKQNNRTSGIRIFREESGEMQRIKANIGNGEGDVWLDGGTKADVDFTNPTWKFISLVLSEGKTSLYIDAVEVATSNLSKVSWKGADLMVIGSGAPRFTEWGHLSDNSLIDELRIYNKALSATDIANKFAGK